MEPGIGHFDRTKTTTIKPDFYTNKDIDWIAELCLDFLEEKGVVSPCALGFEIRIEYTEGEET
jgi:hypothetical protein